MALEGIEGEEVDRAAKTEHAPRLPPVMGDIRPRHVARHQHFAAVVGADGGVEHGAASTRAHDPEFTRPGCQVHRAERDRAPRENCSVSDHKVSGNSHCHRVRSFYYVRGLMSINCGLDRVRSLTTYRSLQVAIAWWRKYLEQSCSNLPEKPGVFPHIGRDVILLHVFICFSFVRCVTSCVVPKSEQKRAPNDFTKDLFVTCSLCHVFRSLQSESVWPGLRSWHDPWHRH